MRKKRFTHDESPWHRSLAACITADGCMPAESAQQRFFFCDARHQAAGTVTRITGANMAERRVLMLLQ